MTSPFDRAAALAGWLALALVLLLSIGPVLALLLVAGSGGLPGQAMSALRFTVIQAGLSALISTLLAIPLARALARRRFPGHGLLVSLLGAPFLLPALVAVMGLLTIFGRAGPVSELLQDWGLGPLNIYGLRGILLAHVFFNLPLVTRMLLHGWAGIPDEHFRLAAQLGLRQLASFQILELPMLRRVMPGAFLLVFLLCSTSFAVILSLGGGPAATSLEVAIFQALRFDFDLRGAASLALMQAALCAVAAVIAGVVQGMASFGVTGTTSPTQQMMTGRVSKVLDAVCIGLATLFLVTPMLAVVWRGVPALIAGLPDAVWPAALRSLLVALASAAMTLALALALAGLIASKRGKSGIQASLLEMAGYATLAVSPFVMGTGLFILINPVADPVAAALPVTAVINAGLCIPLALRLLLPALRRAQERYGRLAQSLGLHGWVRFRIAVWPEIRRPAMFATGVAAALSMGDLGVIALFAPPDGGTLPLVMQRLMAAYQMQAAAGVALLLVGLAFTLYWLIDLGGRNAD